jgi:hypothetical protein
MLGHPYLMSVFTDLLERPNEASAPYIRVQTVLSLLVRAVLMLGHHHLMSVFTDLLERPYGASATDVCVYCIAGTAEWSVSA